MTEVPSISVDWGVVDGWETVAKAAWKVKNRPTRQQTIDRDGARTARRNEPALAKGGGAHLAFPQGVAVDGSIERPTLPQAGDVREMPEGGAERECKLYER